MDKISLLVVEDDKKASSELERIFERHTDFNLFFADTPSKAIEISKSNTIDLALLDLKLPEMSGIDLIPYLKVNNPDILITIMTGYGEEETPVLAKESGVVDFLEKPLNLRYLLASLNFQEREAKTRKTLRNAQNILDQFFLILDDGILLKRGKTILTSNRLGEELHQKFMDSGKRSLIYKGRQYEESIIERGDITFYHYKDITSAIEMSLSRSRTELARLLSHELHNSLTPLKLYFQEIASLREEDETFKETLDKLIQEGNYQIDRLTRLTKRFKDLSSNKPLSIGDVVLNEVLKEVLRSLSPLILQKNISIKNGVKENQKVFASYEELFQVLHNILLNAVEAVNQNGEIEISAFEDESSVLIKIKDNGNGLPEQLKDDPFVGYLTTKESGTGLGLLLSKELTQRMGGNLEIKNGNTSGVEATINLKKA
jgi:signal transduction histidine kinase